MDHQLTGLARKYIHQVGVTFWWLVRVTLVVDLWFLPQNFGPMSGTYEGLLQVCECR